ncbi:LysE family translocator [Streptomyces gibsoniae]|uniref:LysE family translocator n=1 Tax=Streptomyces gibsoniae TaxID=3075529 RepID=A0ABU2UAC7_9ACTN|nr:LysE family translocator [Streptomyces sp. DSM 41699]MDT0470189.1 LysE family translocator [Streptomyces sp. DSM 41699]
MPDLHQLLAFCALSAFIAVLPGPNVLFVVGRALAHGRRAAVGSVIGNAIGGYALVVVVALGLGTVVERSAPVYSVIKLGGAAYLIFLGVKAVRARPVAPKVTCGVQVTAKALWHTVWEGTIVGATNPKSIVFLTAVLPQFVDRDSGHVIGQMLLLGLVGTLLALSCDCVWGLTASATRDWFGRSPRRLAFADRAGGAAMIVLGLKLALDRTNWGLQS